MSNLSDQDAKREYLTILMKKSESLSKTINSNIKQFFIFALAFFIFIQFNADELSLLGITIKVPLDWILGISPIVLSFSLFRIMSLYDVLDEFDFEIEKVVPETIYGEKWVLEQNRFFVFSENLFWVKNINMTSWRQKEKSYSKLPYYYLKLNEFLQNIVLVGIFTFPQMIITYFLLIAFYALPFSIFLTLTAVTMLIILPSNIMFTQVTLHKIRKRFFKLKA